MTSSDGVGRRCQIKNNIANSLTLLIRIQHVAGQGRFRSADGISRAIWADSADQKLKRTHRGSLVVLEFVVCDAHNENLLHSTEPIAMRLGYDIHFNIPAPVTMVALLNVHPSRTADLQTPDELLVEPDTPTETFIDSFGNRCTRFLAAPGLLRLSNSFLISDSGLPDPVSPSARELPAHEVPHDVLRYLYNSRYCEVDRFGPIAIDLFGSMPPGWSRVQAICDWVHSKVTFGYHYARSTKTALEVFTERTGVCRDFQHLAITMCRALNIPARYATGYLGDIRIPPVPCPMDFSAWFEVYLEDRWWTFDARHNLPRIGRVLMATGRDAADVAITTSFGAASLTQFTVISDEVPIPVLA